MASALKVNKILLLSFFGSGCLLLFEYLVAYFLPIVGVLFWLPTVVMLEILEGLGLPTLQGSPDRWPIATEVGYIAAAALWWGFWFVVVALILRRWHSGKTKSQIGN